MSSAPMLGSLCVPVSANTASVTVNVRRHAQRRLPDHNADLLLECIAAAYRSYHQADSPWAETRLGERRVRLIGRFGSQEPPREQYISIDLEDFQ
jgi:hypothetical protein